MALALHPERQADGNLPALRPLIDAAVQTFLDRSPEVLFDLAGEYGSPLHIVWPHALAANVAALQDVLGRHRVRAQIFYGAKANKSPGLVRAAVAAGVGVDVSSPGEFADALRSGASFRQIVATGPAKTMAFLADLLRQDALISVDSLEELADLDACARAVGRHARILLRFRPSGAEKSRFGLSREAMLVAVQRVALPGAPFQFEGFHFHLSGYAVAPRAQAFSELIPWIDTARSLGLAPQMIDIGGGLPVQYVEASAYAEFLAAQTPTQYRTGAVPRDFYPYGGQPRAEIWLDAFLSASATPAGSIADYLKAEALILALEPGRSLADQAALSLFRVTRVKPLGAERAVIFVEGSSFSACETWFASEFLINPIVIRRAPPRENAPTRAYIAGHSCLDDDVITNRWLPFAPLPQPGDLLLYANTGGYQMDLLENSFHRHPMPRRLLATLTADGSPRFTPDLS